jgi:hypothetical protein
MTTKELINFLQRHVDLNPHMADSPILNGITFTEINGIGIGGKGISLSSDFYGFEHAEDSNWEYFGGLFEKAGIEVINHWELPNGYWPKAYLETSMTSPWWLVQTSIGMIKIGWRKRVITIHWDATPLRTIVTTDDVTKDDTMVHAWGSEKAVEYLTTIASYFPGKGTPNSFVAKTLMEIAEKTQKELEGIAQFAETYLSAEWKKSATV